jgi:hypothetical protein
MMDDIRLAIFDLQVYGERDVSREKLIADLDALSDWARAGGCLDRRKMEAAK